MNCTQAKESISIVSFLSREGFSPVKESNGEYWYLSPFRNEKTASFKVFADEKHWKDHGGNGQGGDIIKLVVLMYNTNQSEALKILANQSNTQSFPFSPAKEILPIPDEQIVMIDHLQPLQNKALVNYLITRKIPVPIARLMVQEAYYHVGRKQYFSIAFRNDAGGYELRNQYFKNCASPKQITTLPVPCSNRLNLFEGFFDAMSFLTHYRLTKIPDTFIVLNSCSMIEHVLPLLKQYERINLFLDNDATGRKTADQVKALHPVVKDYSQTLYPEYNDLNDMIMGKKIT